MKSLKKAILVLISCVMAFSVMTGCNNTYNKTVSIELWHYYSGALKTAFDALVTEFNDGVGRDKNIVIESKSESDNGKLAEKLLKSAQKAPGADKMPDMFMSYADNAYTLNKYTPLANLKNYFTDKEINEYVDDYISEGTLNGALNVFPIAKATETLIINKSEWEKFASEYNKTNPTKAVALSDFDTEVGIMALAEKFYEHSGKALYARDSSDNYFFVGSAQLEKEVYTLGENGKMVLGFNEAAAKTLWDNYYIPYMKGWFSHVDRFGTDCVKNGETIAALGSTSASPNYPDMDLIVRKAPIVNATSKKIYTQQGAGLCIVKGESATEKAGTEFIKWFTESARNTKFSIITGYMPVKKDANSYDKIKLYANENSKPSALENLKAASEMLESAENMYTCIPFDNSNKIRNILKDFTKTCQTDFAELKALGKGSAEYEQKLAAFCSEANFKVWYEKTKEDIKKIIDDFNNA